MRWVTRMGLAGLALSGAAVCGCIEHRIKADPITLNVNMDVNLRVDRQLDDFFGDVAKEAATAPAAGPGAAADPKNP